MTKKIILFLTLFFATFITYGQVTKYKIGKYSAIIDFYKMRMKWTKGVTYSQILEVQTNEKNVRKFQEIEYGKVTGTFETYHITDGLTDGVYKRADGKEFNMKIIAIIKK